MYVCNLKYKIWLCIYRSPHTCIIYESEIYVTWQNLATHYNLRIIWNISFLNRACQHRSSPRARDRENSVRTHTLSYRRSDHHVSFLFTAKSQRKTFLLSIYLSYKQSEDTQHYYNVIDKHWKHRLLNSGEKQLHGAVCTVAEKWRVLLFCFTTHLYLHKGIQNQSTSILREGSIVRYIYRYIQHSLILYIYIYVYTDTIKQLPCTQPKVVA